MTDEEKKDLLLASRVPITLIEYVDDLLYREYQRGYDKGWDDSSKSEGSGSS